MAQTERILREQTDTEHAARGDNARKALHKLIAGLLNFQSYHFLTFGQFAARRAQAGWECVA